MRIVLTLILGITLSSCSSKEAKYYGFDDLVVGIKSVHLYYDQEFRLELGAGGSKGMYQITNDTVYLDYYDKPDGWPDRILIHDDYFETIETDYHKPIRIERMK